MKNSSRNFARNTYVHSTIHVRLWQAQSVSGCFKLKAKGIRYFFVRSRTSHGRTVLNVYRTVSTRMEHLPLKSWGLSLANTLTASLSLSPSPFSVPFSGRLRSKRGQRFQRSAACKHCISPASIILALRGELKRYASPRVVHFVLVSHREQETFFIVIFTRLREPFLLLTLGYSGCIMLLQIPRLTSGVCSFYAFIEM